MSVRLAPFLQHFVVFFGWLVGVVGGRDVVAFHMFHRNCGVRSLSAFRSHFDSGLSLKAAWTCLPAQSRQAATEKDRGDLKTIVIEIRGCCIQCAVG